MTIQNTVLIGNGILRGYEPGYGYPSWESVLQSLSDEFSVPINDLSLKPFPLVFERIRLQLIRDQKNPNTLLRHVAELMDCPSYKSSQLTDIFGGITKNILTTNYNDAIASLNGFNFPMSAKYYMEIDEKYHSLFRAQTDGKKDLWKIHGDTVRPSSILLGYNQYAKYMGQIKDYLYKGIKYKNIAHPLRSPLMGKKPDFNFDKPINLYSWVDIFLRDQIHIVGLGLDFSEIILWWLISEKLSLQAKFPSKVGGIYFYSIQLPNKIKSIPQQCVRNMLLDMGVNVVDITAKDYADGYLTIAEKIQPGIVKLHKNKDFKGMYKLSLK